MDKYMRVKKIGEGAFGKAILVKAKPNGKQCVIKEISLMRMGPKEREDARKEVSVLSQLNHPNIVTYLESFEEKGSLYICMDYCSGGDLYSKINQQRGALIPEEQIWAYFAQICLAVKHIHDRKILHRDIKSQNIFLTGEGRVKIGDFGIAKVLNNTMELARTCIGTPYYLSPELVENKPYNNKSDVWSLGCVLYEMTTLKHAFEAGNMKNLVLKIIRGVYSPIPPKYSYELRGIIAQLFKRSPRDRPSINSLLRKNIMMQKVRHVLSDEKFAEEFSHTIMHGKKISRALPPAPRPASASSRPTSAASSRPGSAVKKVVNKSNSKYNPAAVYGAPLVRKSRDRPIDLKKKNNSGGARPIPGQAEWDKRRQELKEKERARRDSEKQKEQELFAKQHKEFVMKQKIAQINRSRESGWKNVLEPSEAQRHDEVREPILQKPQMIIHNKSRGKDTNNHDPYMREFEKLTGIMKTLHTKLAIIQTYQGSILQKMHERGQDTTTLGQAPVENRIPVVEARGNYDNYNAYLDKLQQDRINRIREGGPVPLIRPAAVPYMQPGREQFQYNRERREATERAKLAQEYLDRKQEAALNKARAQAQLHGNRPPSAGVQRVATPKNNPASGAAVHSRNREEQDYLSQLRRIREQNMKERKALQARKDAAIVDLVKYKPPLDEERKKKIDALKKQADEWKNKDNNLAALRRHLEDEAKSRPPSRNAANSRPGSANANAKANMKPAPAVPITGVLQAIGADNKQPQPAPAVPITGALQAIGVDNKQPQPSPKPDDKNRQIQKENILKRLNEKNPNRAKWGEPEKEFVPAATAIQDEVPNSARSQWGEGQGLNLANMPLEETSSQMEATSARDQVIRSPDGKLVTAAAGASGDGAAGRQGWGQPGSTVVKVLQGLPIIDGTITSTSSGSETSEPKSPVPRVDIVSGIGATVTISKPSMVREGTITIKSAEESTNKELLPVAPSSAEQNIQEIKTALSAINQVENQGTNQTETTVVMQPQNETDTPTEILNVQSKSSETEPAVSSNESKLTEQISNNDASQSNVVLHHEETISTSAADFDDKTPRQSVAERLSNKFNQDSSVSMDLPEVPKKPEIVFKKPVLLPKPDLSSAEFAKPVIAPVVINHEGEGCLFAKVELLDDEDDTKTKSEHTDVNWDDATEQKSDEKDGLSKGLSTGNFDIGNVTMLRTCSEPDLSKLFQTTDNIFLSDFTRHASLDRLNTVREEIDEDFESLKKSLELELISPRSKNSKTDNLDNVKIENKDQKTENLDEDDDDDDEDDDDDIISVRATMQSLLIEDDDDDESVKFNISNDSNKHDGSSGQSDIENVSKDLDSETNLKNSNGSESKTTDVDDNNDDDVEDGNDDDGDEDDDDNDNDDDDDDNDRNGRLHVSQSDSVLRKSSTSLNSDTFSELFQCDSDGETTFGDDDNVDDEDDYDVYGRLEQAREELEKALGFDLFIKVYNAIQVLQEDEDEKIEEGAKIALDMLGQANHHLYPKIFQLVMADTAFTEDNV